MGWQIVFVDAGNKLRNGRISMFRKGEDVEADAWNRAAAHDALVTRAEDKIINVVCVKNR